MIAHTQTGILPLQAQEPGNVPLPPAGSYYFFINIFDSQMYIKDSRGVCFSVIGPGLAIFANNAAAIAAGLVPGQLYRTGADPDLVAVVH